MTREQIIQRIGKDAIEKETPDPAGGETLYLKTVPNPHREFEAYVLKISKKDGLLKIIALTRDVDTTEDGAQLSEEFSSLADELRSVYGTPSNSFDFVRAGSIWDAPNDFMMGLVKGDRTLSVDWTSKPDQPPLKDRLSIVALDAKALRPDRGYMELTYEFQGWEDYVDLVKSKESTVF